MKVRIKSFNSELRNHLTLGKNYVVIKKHYYGCNNDFDISIISDNGIEIYSLINNSAHLNGGSWEIVNEN